MKDDSTGILILLYVYAVGSWFVNLFMLLNELAHDGNDWAVHAVGLVFPANIITVWM